MNHLKELIGTRPVTVVFGTGVSAAITDSAPHATWRGLIENAVQHLTMTGGDTKVLSAVNELLAIGTTTGYLAAAGLVKDALSKKGSGEYEGWLSRTVGELPVEKPELRDLLLSLPHRLATTNYDTLVSSDSRRPQPWNRHREVAKIISGGKDIIHLHGVWDDPESTIFTAVDYALLQKSEVAVDFQKVFSVSSAVVYIGFGAGLDDPNLGQLLEWHTASAGVSAVPHYRLCVDSELEALRVAHAGDHVTPISYGAAFEDLVPYLSAALGPSDGTPVNQTGVALESVSAARADIHQSILDSSMFPARVSEEVEDWKRNLLPPVILPVAHGDFVHALRNEDESKKHERLDPTSVAGWSGTTILVADENSGLTSALRWLSLQSSASNDDLPPFIINFSECRNGSKPLSSLLLPKARSTGLIDYDGKVLPPFILAVDEFRPYSRKYAARFAKEIAEHGPFVTIIGCRSGEEDELARLLRGQGIEPRVTYLGRLHSGDIATLAQFVAPAESENLVKIVERSLRVDNLPRTPFTVSLLLSVLVQNGELRLGASETDILSDYISLLLGKGDPREDARITMEQKSREAVLGVLAQYLVTVNHGAAKSSDILRIIETAIDQFGWSENAYDLLQYFLDVRVLSKRSDDIGFARSSYLHLFAAKRATVDDTLYQHLITDPLYYSSAISDYAALNRHDPRLLRRLIDEFDRFGLRPEEGGVFEAIELRAVPDELFEPLETEDEEAPAEGEGSDLVPVEVLDEDAPPFPSSRDKMPPSLELLRTLDLVSSVLRDSDQIEDKELRSEALLEVLGWWGGAINELSRDGVLREMMTAVVQRLVSEPGSDGADEVEIEEEYIELGMRLTSAIIVLAGIGASLASRKLLGTMSGISDPFKGSSAAATAYSFLAFSIGEKGWPSRIQEVLSTVKVSWVVRDFLLNFFVEANRSMDLDKDDERGLMQLCVSIIDRSSDWESPAHRSSARASMLTNLELMRTQRRMRDQAEQSRIDAGESS